MRLPVGGRQWKDGDAVRTGLQFIGTKVAAKFRKLAKELPEVVNAEMAAVANDAKGDFEKTTATWKNRPKFHIVRRPRSWTVTTDDPRYRFVDKGTRPHLIRPKGNKPLAFAAQYQAKTKPRVIASRAGGSSGPTVFTRKPVHHPGTKAREFSATIFAKWQRKTAPRVRKALKNGIQAVGL